MNIVEKTTAFGPTSHRGEGSVQSGEHVREAVLQSELSCLLRERNLLREQVVAFQQELDRRRHADLEPHDCAALEAERDFLQGALAYQLEVLQQIYGSRSWRYSRPGRVLGRAVRRLIGMPAGEPVSAQMPAVHPELRATFPIEIARPISSPTRAPHVARPRTTAAGLTILVAADMLPLFDHSSGGLRLKTLIDLMGEAGHRLIFASLMTRADSSGVLATPEGMARYEEALRRSGVEHILYGPEDVWRHLHSTGREIDIAFLSFQHVTSTLLPWVRSHCPTSRVFYDMVDFHGLRMSREAALANDPALQCSADRQRDIEIACARACDLTLAINAEEKAAVLEFVPEAVVEVLPNVFDIPMQEPPGLTGRKDVLFIGGFLHRPNVDAVLWFVDRIWPQILAAQPEVRFRIVGSNASNEVLALGARPGVDVLGFLPDVHPVINAHRVSVAPLRWGAGAKGKVGQALAFGLPVVTTPIGAEGMNLRAGEHLLVAVREEEFAVHVLTLLRDDRLWQELAMRGRVHMQQNFSTEVVRRHMEALIHG